MNEFERIKHLFAPLATHSGAYGLTDDAATIACPPGCELVVTKDVIAEGVHYIGDEPPGLIAKKLLRVNLSDLAAMGATPLAYLLAVMLPPKIDDAWLAAFADGLMEDQTAFNLSLLGGDSISLKGDHAAFSLTAIGSVPNGKALRRSGAKPGDLLLMSGTLGDGALGLQLARDATSYSLDKKDISYLIQRYRQPKPRTQLGSALIGLASACMDISDGLVQDGGHIADHSQVALTIHTDKLPLSDAARHCLQANPDALQPILTGGDDYELLFTLPPDRFSRAQAAKDECNTPIAVIGEVSEGTGIEVLDASGCPILLSRIGWMHG